MGEIDSLFRPRAIAVVGVPSSPDAPPFPFFRCIREGGFDGPLPAARLHTPVNDGLAESRTVSVDGRSDV